MRKLKKFLITNDRHFNILKSLIFPPIKLFNIEDFKSILTLQF